MRAYAGIVVLLAIGAASMAQVTPEEATRRLEEKQKQRQADRSKKVTISQGELDDLRAQIAQLIAEIQSLRQQLAGGDGGPAAAAVPAPVKVPTKIQVGITRQQLDRFVAVHKDRCEITSDLPGATADVPIVPDQKVQTVKIVVKEYHKVKSGTSTNGVSTFQDFRKELRPDAEMTVVVIDGTVASVKQIKFDQRADEL